MFVDLGGLRVTCSPRDPKISCSNSAEVDGCKNPEHKSSRWDIKHWIPSLRFQAEKISSSANFNRHIHILVIA